ncbi:hypothetical protein BaRGS_00040559, partial [Batillaria attramentaria]
GRSFSRASDHTTSRPYNQPTIQPLPADHTTSRPYNPADHTTSRPYNQPTIQPADHTTQPTIQPADHTTQPTIQPADHTTSRPYNPADHTTSRLFFWGLHNEGGTRGVSSTRGQTVDKGTVSSSHVTLNDVKLSSGAPGMG